MVQDLAGTLEIRGATPDVWTVGDTFTAEATFSTPEPTGILVVTAEGPPGTLAALQVGAWP